MSVKIDIIEGAGGTKGPAGWTEAIRVAKVYGVTGSGQGKLDAAITELEAYEAGAGTPNSAHPSFPGLYLQEISPTPESTDVVVIRLTYRNTLPEGGTIGSGSDQVEIEAGSSVTQQETNHDIEGTDFKLTWTPPGETHDPKTDQGCTTSVLRPQTTITYRRKESASPGRKARKFVGKVNTGGWALDPSADAGTWLCTGIVGRSSDKGKTYDVSYSFQYCEGGWRTWLYWRKPETGNPPDGVTVGNGIEEYWCYYQINFDDLYL